MLTPGTRLGPYEIVAPLGAGGMGEVYRARDSRLGRDVAIKTLPDSLAGDPERLARLEREARLLASMSHAGIAALYGLEDAGGRPALVMEVVEGPTLAERLERGPLPEDEALAVARQLAEALEYAHDLGVVHRDLKPANIKLRPDGTVKVLDFGLARAFDSGPAGSSSDLTHSPTLTNRMTSAGVILGTAAYMAPEQARGRTTDRRADVWAFGVVMYEMLSGRRAFAGETVSEILASVMRDEPDWSALPSGLAPGWRPLIRRCLAKDPRARLQAIGEARIALGDLSAVPVVAGDARGPARAGGPGSSLVVALAAAVVAMAALAGWALTRRTPAVPAAREVSIMLPAGQRLAETVSFHFFALSPDGRSLVYSVLANGHRTLHLRRLDRRDDLELPGTEDTRDPFFSPDGEWIGFFNSLKLCKISVRGGTLVELTEAGQDRLGTWLDDGTIVYAKETTTPLLRLPAAGGVPVAVTKLDTAHAERSHRWPCALSGGPWVVFTVGRMDSPGGYDDSPIDAVNVKTGERRRIVQGARRAIWAPPHWLIYCRSGDLYAGRIDPKDPRPVAESAPVLTGVAGEVSSGATFFDISQDGTLAWIPADPGVPKREIGWLDRSGRWTPTSVPPGEYQSVKLSPDRTHALVLNGTGAGGASDIWLADLASGGMTRLTFGMFANSMEWSTDGARFVYSRTEKSGGESIVVRRVDGAGGERVIDHSRWPLLISGLVQGADRVVYSDYGPTQGRIHTAALDGDPDVRTLEPDAGNELSELAGVVSPDGRWLAYVSNKTHREEVCLRALDGSGGRWQVTNGGAGGARWGRDGRELFYAYVERLMSVSVQARGDEVVVGQPKAWFDLPPTPCEPAYRDYAYDPVHDRFLATRPPFGVLERREIALSLGWTARLDSRPRGRGEK